MEAEIVFIRGPKTMIVEYTNRHDEPAAVNMAETCSLNVNCSPFSSKRQLLASNRQSDTYIIISTKTNVG